MSVIKRAGAKGTRWGVKVTINGRQKWLGTYATKSEAKAAEHAALAEAASTANADETCGDFAARWLRDYPRERASTNRTHQQAIKQFAEDFADVQLRGVTKKAAREFVLKHRSHHAAIRAMFNDAMSEDLLETNPFAALNLPQSKGRRDIKALTATQVSDLAAAAKQVHPGSFGDRMAAVVNVAAYAGLRRGEVCALRWKDINFKDNEVTVARTLSNDTEFLPPKNGKTRTVVLPPQAADALRSVPRAIDGDQLVFTTTNGRVFTRSNFHYAWHPVRVAANRPALQFHELRHFAATFMVQTLELTPQQTALQLGHTDGGQLVMQLYSHPEDGWVREQIKAAFQRQTELPARLETARKPSVLPGAATE